MTLYRPAQRGAPQREAAAAAAARSLSGKRRSWMEVDFRVGLLLCVVGGAVFAVAVSGWILLFSELSDLKARLQGIREERVLLMAEMRTTMQKLELKLDALGSKLDNIESLARSNKQRAELRDGRLTELQEVIKGLTVDLPDSPAPPPAVR